MRILPLENRQIERPPVNGKPDPKGAIHLRKNKLSELTDTEVDLCKAEGVRFSVYPDLPKPPVKKAPVAAKAAKKPEAKADDKPKTESKEKKYK